VAIKGKKKSQQRGSQARRRPAAAPRPVVGKGTKPPWYKTTAGQSIAAISAMILIVVALVVVNNARSAAEERELAQESLENFTDQVKALTQTIGPPATELAAAAQTPPDDLKGSAEGWRDDFTAAQTQAAQFPPAEGTTTVQQLFAQALNLYRSAAVLYAQAPELDGPVRQEISATAASQVASAQGLWQVATEVLDAAREDLDMDASGIGSPAQAPAPGELPDASATIPIEGEDDEAGGDKSKGGKNSKGDDS